MPKTHLSTNFLWECTLFGVNTYRHSPTQLLAVIGTPLRGMPQILRKNEIKMTKHEIRTEQKTDTKWGDTRHFKELVTLCSQSGVKNQKIAFFGISWKTRNFQSFGAGFGYFLACSVLFVSLIKIKSDVFFRGAMLEAHLCTIFLRKCIHLGLNTYRHSPAHSYSQRQYCSWGSPTVSTAVLGNKNLGGVFYDVRWW